MRPRNGKPPEALAVTHRRAHPAGRRRVERYSGAATEAIGELRHGEDIIGLTAGQFSLLDLVRAVCQQTGPAHLVLSTWTIGTQDVDGLAWLIDTDQVLSCQLAVDGGLKRFAGEKAAYLVWRFGEDAVRVGITHAKFALVRNDEWDLAIMTSMNLSKNPRFEHFQILGDAGTCDMLQAHVESMPRGMSYADAKEHLRTTRGAGSDQRTAIERHRQRISREKVKAMARRQLRAAREEARK